jgi:hypothetical protein
VGSEPSGGFHIFLSYRREDSQGSTGRLHDYLVGGVDDQPGFADEQIFMDIDSGQLGRDYRKKIREAVASCDVLLAVIGRQWTTVRDKQGRRLNNPDDLVRLEIEAALERDIPVVPVLVDGAKLPSKKQVPESLVELVYRDAIALHATSWRHDVGRLLRSLKNDEEEKAKANAPRQSRATQGTANRKTGSSPSDKPRTRKIVRNKKSPTAELLRKLPSFTATTGSYKVGDVYNGRIEGLEHDSCGFGAKVLIGPGTYGTLRGKILTGEGFATQLETPEGTKLSAGDMVRVQITRPPLLPVSNEPLKGAPHRLKYLNLQLIGTPIGPSPR